MDTNCIFCRISSGDIPSTRIYESPRVLAFLDVSPMEKGHALVIPRAHWATMADIPQDDPEAEETCREWFRVTRLLARAAMEVFGGGANLLQCNGASAGQTVPHLHLHVIPRPGAAAAQPSFVSGARPYSSDAEREQTARLLREALSRLLASPPTQGAAR